MHLTVYFRSCLWFVTILRVVFSSLKKKHADTMGVSHKSSNTLRLKKLHIRLQPAIEMFRFVIFLAGSSHMEAFLRGFFFHYCIS